MAAQFGTETSNFIFSSPLQLAEVCNNVHTF